MWLYVLAMWFQLALEHLILPIIWTTYQWNIYIIFMAVCPISVDNWCVLRVIFIKIILWWLCLLSMHFLTCNGWKFGPNITNITFKFWLDQHHFQHLTGLTDLSLIDDLNDTNEDILRRAKQIPTSLKKATKPFNAANYTRSGYRANCMNRWSSLKPHYKA